MARIPIQVLVFPFIINEKGQIEYALFKRLEKSGGYWQAIAGGGEEGETPIDAAKREAWEEAAIPINNNYYILDSCTTIPVVNVVDGFMWGNEVYVATEYSFGVEMKNKNITISNEHQEYIWFSYPEAMKMLKWDSNRNALWELNERILRKNLKLK